MFKNIDRKLGYLFIRFIGDNRDDLLKGLVVFSIVMGGISLSLLIILYKLLFVWNPSVCIHPNHYNLKRAIKLALKSLRQKNSRFDRFKRRLSRIIGRRSSAGDIENGRNATGNSSGQPEMIQTEKIVSGNLSLKEQIADSSYENVTISDGIIITGEEYTGEEKGEKSCQKSRQDESTLDEENWSETQEENYGGNNSPCKDQVGGKDDHTQYSVQENHNDNPNENGNSTNLCSESDSETLLVPPPVPELSDSIAKTKRVQLSKTL